MVQESPFSIYITVRKQFNKNAAVRDSKDATKCDNELEIKNELNRKNEEVTKAKSLKHWKINLKSLRHIFTLKQVNSKQIGIKDKMKLLKESITKI